MEVRGQAPISGVKFSRVFNSVIHFDNIKWLQYIYGNAIPRSLREKLTVSTHRLQSDFTAIANIVGAKKAITELTEGDQELNLHECLINFQRMIFDSSPLGYQAPEWRNICKSIQTAIELQEEWIFSSAPDQVRSAVYQWQQNSPLTLPKEFYRGITLAKILDDNTMEANKATSNREEKILCHRILNDIGLSVTITRSICRIQIGSTISYIPAECFTMLSSKLFDMSYGLLYVHLSEGLAFPQGSYIRLCRLIKWIWSVWPNNLTKFFTFMKNFDGLCIGYILAKEEEWVNLELLTCVWDALKKDRIVFGTWQNSRLVRILNQCTTVEIFEYANISKWFGHPSVDITAGLSKLYTRTHKDINIDPEVVEEVVQISKQSFFIQYRKRNKVYPLFTIQRGCPARLRIVLTRNLPLNSAETIAQLGRINLADWNFVDLLKVHEFDRVPSMIPLLKDTASVSSGHVHWRNLMIAQDNVIKDLYSREEQHSVLLLERIGKLKQSASQRRILMAFLLQQDPFKPYLRYLLSFEKNIELCLDLFIIKLTAKEKELKREGRYFGQSPPEERLRRAVMEYNVSNLMKKYEPNEAMTISEVEKIRKLYFFGKLKKIASEFEVFQFSVDAEGWNSSFRHILVSVFGREILDNIFGTSLYEKTMEVFRRGIIFHVDWAGKITGWEGQEGGIEGLAQKIWAWIYDKMVVRVCHRMQVKYFAMYCGDDMRMAVLMRKELLEGKRLSDVAIDIKQQIAIGLAECGHTIKISETMTSTFLIAFGKVYQHSMVVMPSMLKKVSKATGLIDSGIHFPTSLVASSLSNAHSACTSGYLFRPPYIIGLVAGTYHILNHIKTLGRNQLTMLYLFPLSMGGVFTTLYHQFFMKGESDILSSVLSLWRYIYHTRPEYRMIIVQLLCVPFQSVRNRARLFSSIYSLPLNLPSTGESLLKIEMRKQLERVTKNESLKQILLKTTDPYKKKLIGLLDSIFPLFPKLPSVLLANSIFALTDEILAKFDNSESIFNFLVQKRGVRRAQLVMARCERIDNYRLHWTLIGLTKGWSNAQPIRKALGVGIHRLINEPCSTQLANDIRKILWKRDDIVSLTYPPIPEQIAWVRPNDSSTWIANNHFEVQLLESNDFAGDYPAFIYQQPASSPFFGSTTAKKLTTVALEITDRNPLALKLHALAEAYSQCAIDSPDLQVVFDLISVALSGLTMKELVPIIPRKEGGTLAHRMRARSFEQSTRLNCAFSLTGNVRTRVDTNLQTFQNPADESINFLALRCFEIVVLTYFKEFAPQRPVWWPNIGWFYLQPCKTCTYDISTPPFTLNLTKIPPMIRFRKNPLTSLTAESVRELRDQFIEMMHEVDTPALLPEPLTDELIDQGHMVIASYLTSLDQFSDYLEMRDYALHPTVHLDQDLIHPLLGKSLHKVVSMRDVGNVDIHHLINTFIWTVIFWCTDASNSLDLLATEVEHKLPFSLAPGLGIFSWLLRANRLHEFVNAMRIPFPNLTLSYLGCYDALQMRQDVWNAVCHIYREWICTDSHPIFPPLVLCLNYENRASQNTLIENWARRAMRWNKEWIKQSITIYNLTLSDREVQILEFFATGIHVDLITESLLNREPKNWHTVFDWSRNLITTVTDSEVLATYYLKIKTPDMSDDLPLIQDLNDLLDILILEAGITDVLFNWILIKQQSMRPKVINMEIETASAIVRNHPRSLGIAQIPAAVLPPLAIVPRQWTPFHQVIPNVEVPGIDLLSKAQKTDTWRNQTNTFPQHIRPVTRDLSVYMLRTLSTYTAGSIKALEMFSHLRIPRNHPAKVCCFADGAGDATAAILQYYPNIQIIFNTLVESKLGTEEMFVPPALVHLSDPQLQRCHYQHNYRGLNDLNNPKTCIFLQDLIDNFFFGSTEIIWMDIETENFQDLTPIQNAYLNVTNLALATLTDEGCFIIKFYCSTLDIFFHLVWAISSCFDYTMITRLICLPAHSTEAYLICRFPRRLLDSHHMFTSLSGVSPELPLHLSGFLCPILINCYQIHSREITFPIGQAYLDHFQHTALGHWIQNHLMDNSLLATEFGILKGLMWKISDYLINRPADGLISRIQKDREMILETIKSPRDGSNQYTNRERLFKSREFIRSGIFEWTISHLDFFRLNPTSLVCHTTVVEIVTTEILPLIAPDILYNNQDHLLICGAATMPYRLECECWFGLGRSLRYISQFLIHHWQ